jgi:hypothetical protein
LYHLEPNIYLKTKKCIYYFAILLSYCRARYASAREDST